MAGYKLDIFRLLSEYNNPKAGDIYAALSEEERKGFAPLIVMRWMSGTSDERQIMMLNEFVNPYVFSLGKHPHLLSQLLQVASSKVNRRYYWLGIKPSTKRVEARRVLQQFFDVSAREARLYEIPPINELVEMAESLGWEKAEIAKLQKEFKD